MDYIEVLGESEEGDMLTIDLCGCDASGGEGLGVTLKFSGTGSCGGEAREGGGGDCTL